MDKKALLNLIYHAGNVSIKKDDFSMNGSNDLLILITAAGQIIGTPLLEPDSSNLNQMATDTLFLNVVQTFKKSFNEESFLLLKNAVVKTTGNDVVYRYLYVFTDDIIAATVADSNGN